MATHSSIITWKIPWTEDPGWLQSMGLQRVRHNWATEYTSAIQSAFLPWVSQPQVWRATVFLVLSFCIRDLSIGRILVSTKSWKQSPMDPTLDLSQKAKKRFPHGYQGMTVPLLLKVSNFPSSFPRCHLGAGVACKWEPLCGRRSHSTGRWASVWSCIAPGAESAANKTLALFSGPGHSQGQVWKLVHSPPSGQWCPPSGCPIQQLPSLKEEPLYFSAVGRILPWAFGYLWCRLCTAHGALILSPLSWLCYHFCSPVGKEHPASLLKGQWMTDRAHALASHSKHSLSVMFQQEGWKQEHLPSIPGLLSLSLWFLLFSPRKSLHNSLDFFPALSSIPWSGL